MTRWVRSGNSQKHKKMPGNATKWGEFDNQHVRQAPLKKKIQKYVMSNQVGKHDELTKIKSLEQSFSQQCEKKKRKKKKKFNKAVSESLSVNSDLNEISITEEPSLQQSEKKKKKGKNKNSNKIDSESLSINSLLREITTPEESSLQQCEKKKRIKKNKNYNKIDSESLSVNSHLSEITTPEEPSLQQYEKKKRKKKKKDYNENDSEGLSIKVETMAIPSKSNITCDNSNKSPDTQQDVECYNNSDNTGQHSISKKQRKRKHDKNNCDSNQSLVKNEASESSSLKIAKSKKEKFLKQLQRKREKLGLLVLPRNAETKLHKIKKRLIEKGFPPEKQKEIMRQARRREEFKFRKVFNPSKLCFGCREAGHVLADCPKKSENLKQETGICFKCGSVEHVSFKCPEKIQGFPYAKCFICKEQGHISRECPKNKHGVYPKGGRCKLCGNVNHLKKDCPTLTKKDNKEEENITLDTINDVSTSIDAEVVKKEDKIKTEKKAKIIKF